MYINHLLCGSSRRRLLVCLLMLVSTTHATTQATTQAHAPSPNRSMQSCCNGSSDHQLHGAAVHTHSDGATCGSSGQTSQLAHRHSNGTVNLLDQNYSGAPEYGYKIMRHLDKILNTAHLLEPLEPKRWQQPLLESEQDSLRQTVLYIFTTLDQELLSLALLHKEEWMEIILQPSLEGDDGDANDHFDKASNAFEASLSVYEHLWCIMQPGAVQGVHNNMFTPYDRVAISSGQSSSYLSLAIMFQQRFYSQRDEDALSYGPKAYELLEQAEAWCDQSLKQLGHDLEGVIDEAGIRADNSDEHEAAVFAAKASMASIRSRMGQLLVDMYTSDYVLDMNANLRLEPLDDKQIGDGQLRILTLSLTQLALGLMLYTQLATNEDYRLVIADSCYHLGLVYGYLQHWDDAADQLETSISLYEDLFRENQSLPKRAAKISSRVMQASKKMSEIYLHLPSSEKDAQKRFLQHISFRRYVEGNMSFDQPLADEDENECDSDIREENDDVFRQGHNDHGTVNSQNKENLEMYQTMLNDYLQQNIVLQMDGASYFKQDNVYQGMLHSEIGSMHLAQNQVHEATSELELAVRLLRDSVGQGSYYLDVYDDKNGETSVFSVKIELANTLLSLADAQLQVKKWKSSYDAFEEAMDLYYAELAEGEIPRSNSGQDGKGVRNLAHDETESISVLEEDSKSLVGDDGHGTGSTESEIFVLDDAMIVNNNTATSRIGVF